MRADRLLALLLLLQQRGKMTTKELAEKLEVSSRTVLRDLNDLSALGIPVVAERGKYGGWRLLDEYRKTLLTLKTEEIASLFLPFPETLLKDLGIDQPFWIARQKLFSHLPSIVEPQAQKLWQRIHIDLEPWKEKSENPCGWNPCCRRCGRSESFGSITNGRTEGAGCGRSTPSAWWQGDTDGIWSHPTKSRKSAATNWTGSVLPKY